MRQVLPVPLASVLALGLVLVVLSSSLVHCPRCLTSQIKATFGRRTNNVLALFPGVCGLWASPGLPRASRVLSQKVRRITPTIQSVIPSKGNLQLNYLHLPQCRNNFSWSSLRDLSLNMISTKLDLLQGRGLNHHQHRHQQ